MRERCIVQKRQEKTTHPKRGSKAGRTITLDAHFLRKEKPHESHLPAAYLVFAQRGIQHPLLLGFASGTAGEMHARRKAEVQ